MSHESSLEIIDDHSTIARWKSCEIVRECHRLTWRESDTSELEIIGFSLEKYNILFLLLSTNCDRVFLSLTNIEYSRDGIEIFDICDRDGSSIFESNRCFYLIPCMERSAREIFIPLLCEETICRGIFAAYIELSCTP